ncbi:DUF3284 domain-containing protein [Vagococcus jeotgali]|uniref:DUF3284 domain-containing protein n=1 Tax=Vagococcus jeotgali TaxID=3109030 RepID=UPI002DD88D8A|nr:DUF3284 domain-containing protein [Vagococcus sp. B2T-5]
MKIIKELNIPSAYLYKVIIDSVRYDVEQAIGEPIRECQLENLSYVKEFGKNKRAKITILEIEKNKTYKFETETINNTFISQYRINQLSSTICQLTYSEDNLTSNSLQKINDRMFGIFLGYFKKKRFIQMLNAIEQSY